MAVKATAMRRELAHRLTGSRSRSSGYAKRARTKPSCACATAARARTSRSRHSRTSRSTSTTTRSPTGTSVPSLTKTPPARGVGRRSTAQADRLIRSDPWPAGWSTPAAGSIRWRTGDLLPRCRLGDETPAEEAARRESSIACKDTATRMTSPNRAASSTVPPRSASASPRWRGSRLCGRADSRSPPRDRGRRVSFWDPDA
jgi:hypothetical protein